MNRESSADLSLAEAAVLLEARMSRDDGQGWEQRYQTVRRRLFQPTQSEAQKFYAMLFLSGRSCDPAEMIVGCVWMARERLRDPLLARMLARIRQQPFRAFLRETAQVLHEGCRASA